MVGVFYMVLQKVKVLSGVSCLFGQILNCHIIFISHVIIVIINLQRSVQSQDMHYQQENSYLLYLLVRQKSDIEITLFQCRSYKHLRSINVDPTMFQPRMSTGAYCVCVCVCVCGGGGDILRICLLEAIQKDV